ncbi:MAG: hypothetical protein KA149_07050 [Chitinophagales bacterium]|nr:hypothetical protein [Chitinophagales bacterium]
MKQLFLIFAICFFAAGCKKCYQCTTTVTTSVTGQSSQTGTDRSEVCDKSASEIEQYERDGTGTATSSVGGFTSTVRSVTSCN